MRCVAAKSKLRFSVRQFLADALFIYKIKAVLFIGQSKCYNVIVNKNGDNNKWRLL